MISLLLLLPSAAVVTSGGVPSPRDTSRIGTSITNVDMEMMQEWSMLHGGSVLKSAKLKSKKTKI